MFSPARQAQQFRQRKTNLHTIGALFWFAHLLSILIIFYPRDHCWPTAPEPPRPSAVTPPLGADTRVERGQKPIDQAQITAQSIGSSPICPNVKNRNRRHEKSRRQKCRRDLCHANKGPEVACQ